MAKPLKQGKKSVELDQPVRVSRIRRDPVPVIDPSAQKKVILRTSEREIWLAILGIVLFALAIDIIVVAVSAYTSHTNTAPKGPLIEVRQTS